MPVSVIIGAQYGGEGKGKIVSHLCKSSKIDYVVRCGGPNSGHTVYFQGRKIGLRTLPAGVVNSETALYIAPGALLNPKILFNEMELCKVDPSRVRIDRNTMIITDQHAKAEKKLHLRDRIGSTNSGTGIGVSRRALRAPDVKLAKDVNCLSDFITDVSTDINAAIDQGMNVLVEGTQGFGLSLYHTPFYPYATSRDTTSSGFLSEVGISPKLVNQIIMAVRTFPIRVEGESGPLKNEISWHELQKISGYPTEIVEFTTVTQRIRRIGLFDLEIVKKATMVNRPTCIALHGADYLDYKNKNMVSYNKLSEKTVEFIRWLECELNTPVKYIGTGIRDKDIIEKAFLNQSINLRNQPISYKVNNYSL